MKKVDAAKFKERCLALLDEVGPEGIIITKHQVVEHPCDRALGNLCAGHRAGSIR
ncbi:MAG: hypothetical protein ACREVG_07725 [Burkholderiales bacterium]